MACFWMDLTKVTQECDGDEPVGDCSNELPGDWYPNSFDWNGGAPIQPFPATYDGAPSSSYPGVIKPIPALTNVREYYDSVVLEGTFNPGGQVYSSGSFTVHLDDGSTTYEIFNQTPYLGGSSIDFSTEYSGLHADGFNSRYEFLALFINASTPDSTTGYTFDVTGFEMCKVTYVPTAPAFDTSWVTSNYVGSESGVTILADDFCVADPFTGASTRTMVGVAALNDPTFPPFADPGDEFLPLYCGLPFDAPTWTTINYPLIARGGGYGTSDSITEVPDDAWYLFKLDLDGVIYYGIGYNSPGF